MSGNHEADNAVMQRMQEMCEQSLDPEKFEQWEAIRDRLYLNRKSLNQGGDHEYTP